MPPIEIPGYLQEALREKKQRAPAVITTLRAPKSRRTEKPKEYCCRQCRKCFKKPEELVEHIIESHNVLSLTSFEDIHRYCSTDMISLDYVERWVVPVMVLAIRKQICRELGGEIKNPTKCVPEFYAGGKPLSEAKLERFITESVIDTNSNYEILQSDLSELKAMATGTIAALKRKQPVFKPKPELEQLPDEEVLEQIAEEVDKEERERERNLEQPPIGGKHNLGKYIKNLPELRDYQIDAVSVMRLIRNGTVELPTGAGKTVVGFAVIRDLDPKSVIIVAPTLVLTAQWVIGLKRAVGDVGKAQKLIGEYSSNVYNKDMQAKKPILITTYASARQRPDLFDDREAIIFDEVHHLPATGAAESIMPKVIAGLDKRKFVLGLSATVEEVDEEASPLSKSVSQYLPVVYSAPMQELSDRGFISPLRIHYVPAMLTPEMWLIYGEINDKMSKAYQTLHNKGYKNMRDAQNESNPESKAAIAGLLGYMYRLINEKKKILSGAPDKVRETIKIAKNNRGRGGILLFTGTVDSAKMYKEVLIENGIPARLIIGETPKKKREEILKSLGKEYEVLVSVAVLREGVDVPEVEVGIAVNMPKNPRTVIQVAGRIVRSVQSKPSKVADFYIVGVPDTEDDQAFTTFVTKTHGKVVEDTREKR